MAVTSEHVGFPIDMVVSQACHKLQRWPSSRLKCTVVLFLFPKCLLSLPYIPSWLAGPCWSSTIINHQSSSIIDHHQPSSAIRQLSTTLHQPWPTNPPTTMTSANDVSLATCRCPSASPFEMPKAPQADLLRSARGEKFRSWWCQWFVRKSWGLIEWLSNGYYGWPWLAQVMG